MTVTLIDRIKARKPQQEPAPIADRMGPFARRLLAKQLQPADRSSYILGAFVPDETERGA